MIKISLKLSALVLVTLLTACSPTSKIQEEKYLAMKRAMKAMSDTDLLALEEKGSISAMEEYGGRSCISNDEKDLEVCDKKILEAANKGHPDAMIQTAMFIRKQDPYEAYKWVWIKSHFRRDIYYFEGIAGDFQKLDFKTDYTLMKFLERDLGPDKVAEARMAAELKMQRLAESLEEYCAEWQEKDYVCYYRLGEQPSYEEFEEEFYELNGF